MKDLNMIAPIILFDKPLSALDPKTTGRIQKYLLSLMNKTLIVITHKVSRDELKDFDFIVMIENGKVVLCDTPKMHYLLHVLHFARRAQFRINYNIYEDGAYFYTFWAKSYYDKTKTRWYKYEKVAEEAQTPYGQRHFEI